MNNTVGTGYDLYFTADGMTVGELINALNQVEDKNALVIVGRHNENTDLSPACFIQNFEVKKSENLDYSYFISEWSDNWERNKNTITNAFFIR